MSDQQNIDSVAPSGEGEQIRGRSVFIVETTPAGVAVQTALLTDGEKLISMPAVFPDVQYAFDQIDELKRLVSQHFSEAAKLAAQIQVDSQNQTS